MKASESPETQRGAEAGDEVVSHSAGSWRDFKDRRRTSFTLCSRGNLRMHAALISPKKPLTFFAPVSTREISDIIHVLNVTESHPPTSRFFFSSSCLHFLSSLHGSGSGSNIPVSAVKLRSFWRKVSDLHVALSCF